MSRAGWENNIALLKYEEKWREHRKLCQQNFNPDAAKRYHPIQLERVHAFVRSVLQEPEKVFDHITL